MDPNMFSGMERDIMRAAVVIVVVALLIGVGIGAL